MEGSFPKSMVKYLVRWIVTDRYFPPVECSQVSNRVVDNLDDMKNTTEFFAFIAMMIVVVVQR